MESTKSTMFRFVASDFSVYTSGTHETWNKIYDVDPFQNVPDVRDIFNLSSDLQFFNDFFLSLSFGAKNDSRMDHLHENIITDIIMSHSCRS